MARVGNVLDKIFKTQFENKINLSIEKIINFIFEELNRKFAQQNKCERKEWEEIKNRFNFFNKITLTTDSYPDLKSSEYFILTFRANDIEDIYKYIITDEAKKSKKKKQKNKNQSFDSEVEMFKQILKDETVQAKTVVKIKASFSQEWINMYIKK
jgi:hypothetical protein